MPYVTFRYVYIYPKRASLNFLYKGFHSMASHGLNGTLKYQKISKLGTNVRSI